MEEYYDRINRTWLYLGDGVLFKRGDIFRGQAIMSQPGITYGAYGEGDKPKFYGWDEDLANPALWEEYDKEHHIWKYTNKVLDPGTLVFNDGEKVSRKHIPSFRDMQFVCRDDESKPFVMADEMTENLDIYWHFMDVLITRPSKGEDFPIPQVDKTTMGDLYLRCDEGNPGAVFNSIEVIAKRIAFTCMNNENIRIDNICMKYYCFGVSGGHGINGLHVSNCEIGWIGGNIMMYLGTDPNYPEGRRGSVTRYGNGIEVYGTCNGFVVENNYIYEGYDAGASHQVNARVPQDMKNVLGQAAYFFEGVKSLGNIKPIHLKIECEDRTVEGDFLFGAVSNSMSVGGVVKFNEAAVKLNDGLFEVLLIKKTFNKIKSDPSCVAFHQNR